MESELNASVELTKQMKCTGMVHDHMKKRLITQRIQGKVEARAMKENLREVFCSLIIISMIQIIYKLINIIIGNGKVTRIRKKKYRKL